MSLERREGRGGERERETGGKGGEGREDYHSTEIAETCRYPLSGGGRGGGRISLFISHCLSLVRETREYCEVRETDHRREGTVETVEREGRDGLDTQTALRQ